MTALWEPYTGKRPNGGFVKKKCQNRNGHSVVVLDSSTSSATAWTPGRERKDVGPAAMASSRPCCWCQEVCHHHHRSPLDRVHVAAFFTGLIDIFGALVDVFHQLRCLQPARRTPESYRSDNPICTRTKIRMCCNFQKSSQRAIGWVDQAFSGRFLKGVTRPSIVILLYDIFCVCERNTARPWR